MYRKKGTSGKRRLAFENLERKVMLDASLPNLPNVTASVSSGNLVVRGDSGDNEVAVFQLAADVYETDEWGNILDEQGNVVDQWGAVWRSEDWHPDDWTSEDSSDGWEEPSPIGRVNDYGDGVIYFDEWGGDGEEGAFAVSYFAGDYVVFSFNGTVNRSDSFAIFPAGKGKGQVHDDIVVDLGKGDDFLALGDVGALSDGIAVDTVSIGPLPDLWDLLPVYYAGCNDGGEDGSDGDGGDINANGFDDGTGDDGSDGGDSGDGWGDSWLSDPIILTFSTNLCVPDALQVKMGDGTDEVFAAGLNVKSSATIDTGNAYATGEQEVVALFGGEGSSWFRKDLRIKTGNGDDLVVVGAEIGLPTDSSGDDGGDDGGDDWGDEEVRTESGDEEQVASFKIGGDLEITTNGGYDTVVLGAVPRDGSDGEDDGGGWDDEVVAESNDGSDAVDQAFLEIGDDLTVNTGAGSDQVFVSDVSVKDLATILAGGSGKDDNDLVAIDGLFAGELRIETRAGDDLVQVINSFVKRNVNILTDAGNDDVGLFLNEFCSDVKINLGAGCDNLYMGYFVLDDYGPTGDYYGGFNVIGRDLLVEAGSGDDFVLLSANFIKRDAVINLGDGNDTLDLSAALVLDEFGSQVYDDDGYPVFQGNFVGRNLKIDGGSGFNELIGLDAEGNDFGKVSKKKITCVE